jgi:hypothetical protein
LCPSAAFSLERKKSGIPDAVFMISTPPLHAEIEIKNEIVGK